MNRLMKEVMPKIFFVTHTGKKRFSFSRSAIFLKKEAKVVDVKNIVNTTGFQLRKGDKIIANLQSIHGTFHITVRKIIARQQPIAISEQQYLKSLRIFIADKNQSLDFQELNNILEGILGITVYRVEAAPEDYHLIIDLSGKDPGTKRCPLELLLLPTSYPLTINFPRVSDETKKYLKMVYPDGKITDSRIVAFRLIHFLLHRLSYLDHFDLRKIEERKKSRKALQEGDPSRIPVLDLTDVCLCDWELVHFLAVQPDLTYHSFENMLCEQCIKRRIPVGSGLKDWETLFETIKEFSKPHSHLRTEKHIFYVIESRRDGLILNETPYKSKKTVNIAEKDWNETAFETYESLCNIFVPAKLFDKKVEVRKGDKALVKVETETTTRMKEDEFGFMTKARFFKVEEIVRRGAKIINPSSLFSQIFPFRLNVVLKTGPGTDLNLVKKVAKTVNRLTGWRVKIDDSSFEALGNSFRMLADVYDEWKKADPSGRSRLVAKVNEIVNGLSPMIHEVEDTFQVILYIFPEKYTFIEDVFGDIAFGRALNRIFAVISIFPAIQPAYEKQEPCKDCQNKLANPFQEEMTSLFVIHEVLHIASGLDDHRDCSFCFYNRKEMLPLRRFYCEECIRKGNEQTQPNCLMSYACLPCISTRISEKTLSQILCEKCREKSLPADQFSARQAARMNSLIHHRLLRD